MTNAFTIRPAQAHEAAIIKTLIRDERLDPLNVHWQNFVVAVEGERIIGIAQIKPYRNGRELGSLVVVSDRRENGVGAALIRALLARERGPLVLFCLAFREPYYAKFGFKRCGIYDLPGVFKLKYAVGTAFTRLIGHRVIAMKRAAGLPDA